CGAKVRRKMTLVADSRRPGDPLVAGSRPIRSLLGSPGTPAPVPSGRWLLGPPFYALTLGRRSPKSFFAVAPDPWPGDAVVGLRLVVGELMAHGQAGAAAPHSGDPPRAQP